MARRGRATPRSRQDAVRELLRMKEHHSQSSGGGRLRAAIFGINDGLVTNASLVVGVARARHWRARDGCDLSCGSDYWRGGELTSYGSR
jgi:hypothetical protein